MNRSRRWWSGLSRRGKLIVSAVVVVLLLAVAAIPQPDRTAPVSPSPRPLAAASPSGPPESSAPATEGSTASQSDVFRSAVDLANGVHFTVVTASGHPLRGRFAFAKSDAGVFWADGASISANPDGSVDVSYVGQGTRDAQAAVDVYLGLHAYSGAEAAIGLDLAIHLDSTDGSGNGRLVANGVTYTVASVTQPPPAGATAQVILGLVEASDWNGVYGHLLPSTQAEMSAQEFSSSMSQGPAEFGSILDVRAVGPVIERDQGAWHAAEQPFEIDFDNAGQITTRSSRLVLLFVGGEWRVHSIDEVAAPPLPRTTSRASR
jgi:hypothetical protein